MANAPVQDKVQVAPAASRGCCAWRIAAALLLLRLCVGWHFFAEGIKKVSVDENTGQWSLKFSAEGFFRQATGPLADRFHALVPGQHGWRQTLALPQELTPASGDKLTGWVTGYVKRRQTELAKNKPTEVEIADFVPFAEWHTQIDADRRQLFQVFSKIQGLTEEQREAASGIYQRRALQLADYLVGESLDIQTYRHELWRLAQMRHKEGATEIPFREARIAQKNATTSREPRNWVASVQAFDAAFKTDLQNLLTDDQAAGATGRAADQALTTPKQRRLHRMNIAVTCLTIGVGLCLLTGLLTRWAAIAGGLFLLSVMATQPPWVPGAQTVLFYYQLVELAALVLLAVTSAGRIVGLDGVLHGLCSMCCRKAPTKSIVKS